MLQLTRAVMEILIGFWLTNIPITGLTIHTNEYKVLEFNITSITLDKLYPARVIGLQKGAEELVSGNRSILAICHGVIPYES